MKQCTKCHEPLLNERDQLEGVCYYCLINSEKDFRNIKLNKKQKYGTIYNNVAKCCKSDTFR